MPLSPLLLSMMKKLLLFIFSHSTLDMFSKISDLVGPMSCKLSKQDFKLSNPENANLTSLVLFNSYNELCSSEKKTQKVITFLSQHNIWDFLQFLNKNARVSMTNNKFEVKAKKTLCLVTRNTQPTIQTENLMFGVKIPYKSIKL